jgi:outer membrane lipoprotein-sorting protein
MKQLSKTFQTQSGGFMSRKVLMSLCAVALLTVSAFGQTADELLEKNLKAMGGKDKLKALQAVRMTGTMKMGPMEVPLTITRSRPSATCMDFTIQGMTGTQAYDGTTGWMLMPFSGNKDPQKMTDEMLKDMRSDADFDGPTFDYKAKGNKVEYVGKEDVQGTPAFKLHVTTKDGKESNEYFDAETYLTIRTESTRNVQGQELETETTIGNYKTVDGLTFPYSMDVHIKGKESLGGQSINLDKIELNPKVDASIFAMPAPAAAVKPEEKKQ